jgi:lipooligosaccharide transport system permease protein
MIIGPVFYLVAIGIGVGSLVDSNGGLGSSNYLQFAAPGLLAATSMQTAATDNSWPVYGAVRTGALDLMLTTPIRVVDLVIGNLLWTLLRLIAVLLPLTIVIVAIGAIAVIPATLALAAAALTGLAFAPAIAALCASLRRTRGITALLGVIVTPLFILGGAFFPLDRLPDPLPAIGRATPLYQGIALTRGLAQSDISPSGIALHLGVLLACLLVGLALCAEEER